jgi:alpha-L-fucosidase
MGNSWSYVPDDKYKSAHQLIHLLVKVVSRGGNFLLNIGPGPDGDWDPVAYQRLDEIGAWMKTNSEGIYNSKSLEPYSSGNIFFTQSKDGKKKFAYYLLEDTVKIVNDITIKNFQASPGAKISVAGSAFRLKWKNTDGHLVITLPKGFAKNSAEKHALCFIISS